MGILPLLSSTVKLLLFARDTHTLSSQTIPSPSLLFTAELKPTLFPTKTTHSLKRFLFYMASISTTFTTTKNMAEPSSGTAAGAAAAGVKSPLTEQNISYSAQRVIGNGSFGVVFEAKVVETGKIVAIKKVLQDKRFKNRELQIMRQLVKDPHPNIVALEHCFYSQVCVISCFCRILL